MRDVSFLLRPEHLGRSRPSSTTRKPRRTTAGSAIALLRNARWPRSSSCPSARTPAPPRSSARRGSRSGPAPTTRSTSRRGSSRPTREENLRYSQTVPSHVRRGQLRDEPPRADRPLRDGRHGVQVPLRREGRRLGEQDVPLPGDEGAPQPGQPREVPRREDEDARHRGVPAVPPRVRRRRDVGRGVPQDRQARLHRLPRPPPDDGQQGGTGVPRPRAGGEAPRRRAEVRLRGSVRREVFRARRPRRPSAAPRRIVPGRRWASPARPTGT